jgi:multisubunit Na+/H+ antiporter MnhB subunit
VTPLIRAVVLAVLPISFLISLAYLIRAEEAPGDGFTAGIISSLGLTLAYLAFGYREARDRFLWARFEVLLFVGLLVTTIATVLPVLGGEPVLGALGADLTLPLIGEISLSRGLLFDFGIYLVVLGGTMSAIDAMERAIE